MVAGTNILDALANVGAASTAPVGVADVVGLTAALAAKQAVLSSASSLQLDNLTCSRLRPATGQNLQLSDAAGIVQLALSSNAATFLRTLSAPSIEISSSALVSGVLLLAVRYMLADKTSWPRLSLMPARRSVRPRSSPSPVLRARETFKVVTLLLHANSMLTGQPY